MSDDPWRKEQKLPEADGGPSYQFSIGNLLFAVTVSALMMAEIALISARLIFLWILIAMIFLTFTVIEFCRRRNAHS